MSGIDVIGFLGTAVTVYSFLASLLPGGETQGATVSIRTSNGYDMNGREVGNSKTGGVVHAVYGYDAGNVLLGVSSEKDVKIGPGGEHTFTIDQGNNVQALYIDIVAADDAVCIPVIGVTQPGDGLKFGWVGDVFTACGLDHYYGNVVVDTAGNQPDCGWIDANHDNIDQASFKWYLPAFSKDEGDDSYSKDTDFYCHPRPLEVRYDAQPIEKREQIRARRRANFKVNELIVSPHAAHPASVLCEREHSVGPDFVSLHEKTFCDMGTKQWYKLCDEKSGILDQCYDLNIDNKTMSAIFPQDLVSGLTQSLFAYDQITGW